jgi:STE24 endopeptidase
MLLEVIISIVFLSFALELVLMHLQQRSIFKLPDLRVRDLYDDGERNRAISYETAKYRLNLFTSAVSTIILILALSFGFFGELDRVLRERMANEVLISLLFIGTLAIISWVISLPESIYSTFVIEEKFGFNKSTVKTFVTDSIKGGALALVLGGGLIALVLWLYQVIGDNFWFVAWLSITAISIFMFMFGSRIILPLFNKLSPLPEGELKIGIAELCDKYGYQIRNLYLMDGSRRSTKANAFFTGLGRSKTIVLFDTLIEKLNQREILAVLAHELGHDKRRHTMSMLVFSTLQSLAIFFLLGWALRTPEISSALGAQAPSFHLSALAFFILLTPLSVALGLLVHSFSRRNEYQADQFALESADARDLSSALKKISRDSLSHPNPNRFFVAFHYTHPPLAQRLEKLES